jgi:predicted Zn-dependent peptidase
MKTNIRGLFFPLIIGACTIALSQKQVPPEGAQPKDFTLPPKTTFMLDNGLSTTLVQFGTIPKVTVRVVVRAGNINEAENEVWLADLTGDMMKEGTTTHSSQEIAKDAARMGGGINITVGDDQTQIAGEVLSEFGGEFVGLLADVIRNPKFPESELRRLKNDRIRQLSIDKADPTSMTTELFRKLIYPNHPYGRVYPTEKMLQDYTLEQVKKFYSQNFGARRTHIYVAGKFDAKAMETAIREVFKDWVTGPAFVEVLPKPVSKREVHIIDRPGAPQSTIFLGLPVIDPSQKDYRPFGLMNQLLGGSFASRITANIREDKGYTYSPGSFISSRFRSAYWVQVADVTTAVTGPSLKEIFFEINRLQKEPPSAEELKGIQNYAAGVFVLQNSSANGIINQLSFLDFHGLPESYLTDAVKNIHAVTPGQVQQLCAAYLKTDQMTIVIAGDKKKIEKQVAPYGKVIP